MDGVRRSSWCCPSGLQCSVQALRLAMQTSMAAHKARRDEILAELEAELKDLEEQERAEEGHVMSDERDAYMAALEAELEDLEEQCAADDANEVGDDEGGPPPNFAPVRAKQSDATAASLAAVSIGGGTIDSAVGIELNNTIEEEEGISHNPFHGAVRVAGDTMRKFTGFAGADEDTLKVGANSMAAFEIETGDATEQGATKGVNPTTWWHNRRVQAIPCHIPRSGIPSDS